MKSLIKSDVFKIILLFLVWRIGLFVVAAIASQVLPPNFGKSFPYYQETLISSRLPYWVWPFGNFDGVHYLRIAQDGYAYQYTQAFFPLYPLLIRAVSFITFGNFVIAGLLISNLAFLVALILFHKVVRNHFDQKIATWSVLFLLAFPTSFYFGSVYTEGIFFLTVIASFYFFEYGQVFMASLIGAVASATRLAGLFLTPALALKKEFKSLIPILIVPLGLIAYAFYLKIKFNNPFYFLTAQTVWGQERSVGEIILLPQVIYRYLKILLTTSGLPLLNASFELISTLFALIILIFFYKKIKKEWLVFSLIAVLLPTLTGTLASMPRYIVVVFPIYLVLGSIKSIALKITLLVIFGILSVVAIALFTGGYWVA